MSKRKRFGVSQALTRGISETIHVVENNAGLYRNAIIPLSRIELDPDNPRKLVISLLDVQNGFHKTDARFEQKQIEYERLKELAYTIESSGIINPIVVYKRGEAYRVVAGERRCLASIIAGKHDIEARIFNDKPKEYELKLIQWIENTAREDLTLHERIGNIDDILIEYQKQYGPTSISATLLKNITGLSLPQASYYLTVLNAPDDVKDQISKGTLRSLDKAAVIASIESVSLRTEAINACLIGCSLKELRKMVAREKLSSDMAKTTKLPIKQPAVRSRIHLGSTGKMEVVQTLVNAVLTQSDYAKYTDMFANVNWNHTEHTIRAFRKLIGILEQETVR